MTDELIHVSETHLCHEHAHLTCLGLYMRGVLLRTTLFLALTHSHSFSRSLSLSLFLPRFYSNTR